MDRDTFSSRRILSGEVVVTIDITIPRVPDSLLFGFKTELDVAATALELFAQSPSLDKGHVSKLVDVLHHYQGRAQSPHVPSAFLIRAKGLTVQAAIASLIFQVLQQRPASLVEHNLDTRMFTRARASVTALWDLFAHLMRVLGGCLIYISMGSVGPDEFAVVEKFVKTTRAWDGPLPICVTIIHPFTKGS
ncbi:hypothetical protein B0T24DRAFT_592701 [Lasiosphaeria ovina]|uniref:Uncharacterized protein n=1 Tax=Lasiosphaeria ovina TaxID=92902 RepID=A0AAE0NB96_9PEZI|nr:hypothetical protein B0T24DRAFT_592701 [Lasiosphaeria ovina]